MLQKQLLNIIALIWLVSLSLLLFGCTSDPNEKANKLYVSAVQHAERMKSETGSYTKVFEFYSKAQKDIDLILTKYSSSDLGVRLISGETRISGFTLHEFRELKTSLKLFAEAEKYPFSCALVVAKAIDGASSKARALSGIAANYAEAGQFTQALETAKAIDDASSKAGALSSIAAEYAKAGQKPSQAEIAQLRYIVLKTKPIKEFWK